MARLNREQIRQTVADVVTEVFTGPVFTGRYFDAREHSKYVSVFIESGNLIHGYTGYFATSATLVISIHATNVTDAKLDEIGDSIQAAISADTELKASIGGMLLDSFSYEDDERDGAQSLNLSYTITY